MGEKVIGALAMSRGVYARTRACVFDLEKVGVPELCSGGFCVSFFSHRAGVDVCLTEAAGCRNCRYQGISDGSSIIR